MLEINPSVKESIHLEEMPVVNQDYIDPELEETYEKLMKVRDDILKALEEARRSDIIRHPYEAKVVLSLPDEYRSVVEKRIDWIKFFFTVSQVELSDQAEGDVIIGGEKVEGGKIAVKKASGEKCPRCWIYDESVGKDGQPVCDRCMEQLERMEIKISDIEEAK